MGRNAITSMLKAWDKHTIEHYPKIALKTAIPKDDLTKIDALAEVYQIPREDVIANLITSALREVEEKMPYIQGQNVVRVEEGDPVYEDAGHMPEYLRIKGRLEKASETKKAG